MVLKTKAVLGMEVKQESRVHMTGCKDQSHFSKTLFHYHFLWKVPFKKKSEKKYFKAQVSVSLSGPSPPPLIIPGMAVPRNHTM